MPTVRDFGVPLYQQGFTQRVRLLRGLGDLETEGSFEDIGGESGDNGGGNGGGDGGGNGGGGGPDEQDFLQALIDQGAISEADAAAMAAGISSADISELRAAGANDQDIEALAKGETSFAELMQEFEMAEEGRQEEARQEQARQEQMRQEQTRQRAAAGGGAAGGGAPSGGGKGGGAQPPQKPQLPPGPAPRVPTGAPQAPSWFTQKSRIFGTDVPNWVLVAVPAALLFFSGGSDVRAYSRPPRRTAR